MSMKWSDQVEARFWTQVQKSDGCWIWTGKQYGEVSAKKNHGIYGMFRFTRSSLRVQVPAHKMSWMIANGPIPDGAHILHKCDHSLCVRPDHLYAGTHTNNMRDRRDRERCPHKLGFAKAEAIRKAYAQGGITYRELAAKFGVRKAAIADVVLGHTWMKKGEAMSLTI